MSAEMSAPGASYYGSDNNSRILSADNSPTTEPADLRSVDAGGIIRHVYRSTDQHLQGKLPSVPLWCRDGDRAVSGIVLQPS